MSIKRDTYTFSQYESSELLDAANNDVQLACTYAINQAEEHSRIYAIPCRWDGIYNQDTGCFTVYRYRNAKEGN